MPIIRGYIMRLSRIIRQSAKYSRESGADVEIDRAYSTVCISGRGQEDIFMQGDDAEQFIDQIDAISKRCPSIDFDDIELHLAKDYIDCLWA